MQVGGRIGFAFGRLTSGTIYDSEVKDPVSIDLARSWPSRSILESFRSVGTAQAPTMPTGLSPQAAGTFTREVSPALPRRRSSRHPTSRRRQKRRSGPAVLTSSPLPITRRVRASTTAIPMREASPPGWKAPNPSVLVYFTSDAGRGSTDCDESSRTHRLSNGNFPNAGSHCGNGVRYVGKNGSLSISQNQNHFTFENSRRSL